MRYISLKSAEAGMRLAYDIYDSYGHTLVGANKLLTDTYIERLEQLGFDGVYIVDKLSEDIEIELVITPQIRAEGLACIRERNIDGCKEIAKRMVDEIMNKGRISLDLTDIRTFDDYTYAHSVNVAVIACIMGIGYQLNAEDLQSLVIAALLHDIGKLMIPPYIINKRNRLSIGEVNTIKKHPKISYEFLSNRSDISAQAKNAILFHHENVDGSGYPDGLDGSEQTLFTKILHVADVYDALISKRPYKAPYSPKEAAEYLMGGCGILFDHETVEVLLKYVPLYAKGTEVKLSNGRKGIIYENSGIHNLRPIVRLYDGTLLDLTGKEYLSMGIRCDYEEEQAENEMFENERRKMLKGIPPQRILAVDDTKANLLMLQDILGHAYDMILVKSGLQALEYLSSNPKPDLILMDIDMPEMNGIEATKEIYEKTNRKVPVLFVTALCTKETVLKCRELNASGYIIRPYKPVYIKSEVKRVLDGSRINE